MVWTKELVEKTPRVWTGKHALISVYDKTDIEEFAVVLVTLGWTILASGGTAAKLILAGVPVTDVAEVVGGKEILGHRVVTLSREVHGGLLARNLDADVTELERLGIPRIDLVCVDMYPLEAEIAREGSTLESVIEKTDIGGPAMLRSGAKGGRIVLCDPADRKEIARQLFMHGDVSALERRVLAAKAEFVVAKYGFASAEYLGEGRYVGFLGTHRRELCYGENKRQGNAAFYASALAIGDPLALDKLELVEGGPPSYVNMTDIDRIIRTSNQIGAGWELNFGYVPSIAVAVKHGNGCGEGVDHVLEAIIPGMVSGDPEAISGSVVLVNREVDGVAARSLRSHMVPDGQKKRVLDSVIAPSFTDEAVEELARKTGKCRLFKLPGLAGNGLGLASIDASRRFRQVRGGFLTQDGDSFVLKLKDEWKEQLDQGQCEDLVLAWAIGSTSNSNTITLVKDGKLIGQGVNQRSRVMAAKVALLYANTYEHSTHGAVAYSDSFFPFPDGPMVLADAGVSVILATSGSIRDEEVAKACAERGVKLLTLPDAEARGFYGH